MPSHERCLEIIEWCEKQTKADREMAAGIENAMCGEDFDRFLREVRLIVGGKILLVEHIRCLDDEGNQWWPIYHPWEKLNDQGQFVPTKPLP